MREGRSPALLVHAHRQERDVTESFHQFSRPSFFQFESLIMLREPESRVLSHMLEVERYVAWK